LRRVAACCRTIGRRQWRARQLRQARQQLQDYCDWPVFGRTELDGELFASEFDLSGSGVPSELHISVDLRPIASTMKRFR
jgi:hypothetical protein